MIFEILYRNRQTKEKSKTGNWKYIEKNEVYLSKGTCNEINEVLIEKIH